jgi:hypothetical protein
LITLIFLSPPAVRTTVNSVCSSAASAGAAAAPAGGGDGHRRGGGDAPLFFQQLGELSGFQDGQGGQVVHQLFEIGHVMWSLRERFVGK